MKLIIKLANVTAEYQLKQAPSIKYEGDTIEIVEQQTTVVKPTAKPVSPIAVKKSPRECLMDNFDLILEAIKGDYCNQAIAEAYGIHPDTVLAIRKGKHKECPPDETYPILLKQQSRYAYKIRSCQKCGHPIHVARLESTGGKAKLCIQCQSKLEENR
jgi:hypothetical protein